MPENLKLKIDASKDFDSVLRKLGINKPFQYIQHVFLDPFTKNEPIIPWELACMLTTPFNKIVHLHDNHQLLVSRYHGMHSEKIFAHRFAVLVSKDGRM
jgi:hypothetical protein